MLIRSQNKDIVIVLSSCDALYMASDREDGKTVYEIRVGFNMGGQTIGRYGTEERAKEVLEEFIEYCMIVKDYYSGVCHTADDMEPYREMKFGCYDMPAE